MGSRYLLGKFLVITSVSTVLDKSTTPSRLGDCLVPLTVIPDFPFEVS